MYWANFLHIYQPPTQTDKLIKQIAEESYLKIVEGLLVNPEVKITLNINGVLTESLARQGFGRLLDNITLLCKRGQIEFVDSAKYHPILPLIPDSEVIRQIKLNNQTNRKYFGSAYRPKGFFCPEMAYHPKLGKILEDLGYSWLILDQITSGKENISSDRLYKQSDCKNLYLFFRNRQASDTLAIGAKNEILLLNRLKKNINNSDKYLITAIDGETIGHHKKGYDTLLYSLYQKQKEFIPITISELFDYIDKTEEISPVSSSWSSSKTELENQVPYALWNDPQNKIHKAQWELTAFTIKAVKKSKGKSQKVKAQLKSKNFLNSDNLNADNPKNWQEARDLLDQALHSDQFWWASGRIIFKSFLLWSEEMIKKGAELMLNVNLKLKNYSSADYNRAQNLYYRIITETKSQDQRRFVKKQQKSIGFKR